MAMDDIEEIILYFFSACLLGMYILASTKASADNEITIDQSGANFNLNVEQVGHSNVVKKWNWEGIDGVDNTVDIRQKKDYGSSSDKNVLEIRRVWGDGNNLALGQGWLVDSGGNFTEETGGEYGGTFAHINVTGDNNNIAMQQTTNQNNTGHEYWLHVEGDDNDIYTKQQGSGQFINLDIFNDGNDVSIIQKNSGSHDATVKLYGSEPTSISVLQNSWSDQSYSITQTCVTVGGCSVSVTQE